ncbi:MAG: hypothetical protein R6U28_08435 [Cyclonatronaceae bacterium]
MSREIPVTRFSKREDNKINDEVGSGRAEMAGKGEGALPERPESAEAALTAGYRY